MYTLVKIYLLLKSLLGTFRAIDIFTARALAEEDSSSWLLMIADMPKPNKLPEAWSDFYWELMHRGGNNDDFTA